MLHTRVACRARTWDVLDVRRDEDVTWWWLRQDRDAPRLLAAPPDIVTPLAADARRVSRRAWLRAMLARLRAEVPSWWPATAARLPIDELPWQCVAAMLVLSGRHRRVLVADPVGMGKTVQAALLLREVHDRDPEACSLVVTPAGLVAQWARELRHRAGLDATVIDAARLRIEALMPARLVDESRRGACWLVSIDLLRQADVTPLFTRLAWTLTVVDEAHAAAPATARLEAVRAIADSSARVLLLTGTPTAGGVAGLQALRAIGARHHEPPMPILRREPARPGPARRSCVLHVRLDRQHAALCARLDAFAARARADRGGVGLLPALVLRRRAASCPDAIARSLERRLTTLDASAAHGGPHQPALFDDIEDRDEAWLRLPAWRDEAAERRELEELLALARRLSPHGRKLAAVARLLRRGREPALVFTAYVDTARALRDRLEGVRLALVHGRLPDALRAQAIDAFTTGDADVLITTDASAEGLNLQARCRLVVHADLPVSPRLLAQRTGRVDRLGQHRRVHEVLLASQATEDVEMLARLETGTAEDAAWLEGPGADREHRRTRIAQACWVHTDDTPVTSRTGPRRLTCALTPARWRRLRARWQLPASAAGLQVARLTVSGTTPLATTHLSAAVATPRDGTPAGDAIERLLAHRLRRERARARRLDAWQEQAEAHASRERARTTSHGLFAQHDDTRAPTWRTEPALTVRMVGTLAMRGSEAPSR
jgi:superfamily II DNA or RNA helicase